MGMFMLLEDRRAPVTLQSRPFTMPNLMLTERSDLGVQRAMVCRRFEEVIVRWWLMGMSMSLEEKTIRQRFSQPFTMRNLTMTERSDLGVRRQFYRREENSRHRW